jgi:nitrate reductase NapE component
MTPPRRLTPRERRVLTSFLFIAIPIMLLAMLGAAVSYGRLSGIGPDDPISMAQLVVFTLFQIVAILVGLAEGTWGRCQLYQLSAPVPPGRQASRVGHLPEAD